MSGCMEGAPLLAPACPNDLLVHLNPATALRCTAFTTRRAHLECRGVLALRLAKVSPQGEFWPTDWPKCPLQDSEEHKVAATTALLLLHGITRSRHKL